VATSDALRTASVSPIYAVGYTRNENEDSLMSERASSRALLVLALLVTAESADADHLNLELISWCPQFFDALEYLEVEPVTGAATFRNLADGREYLCDPTLTRLGFPFCDRVPEVGDEVLVKSLGLVRGNSICSPTYNTPFYVGVLGCSYQCRVIALNVPVDIRPRNPRNPFHSRSKGVTSVAILSREGFDATTVNPDTIVLQNGTFFDGSGVKLAGASGNPLCHEADVGGPSGVRDGFADLVCRVETDEILVDRRTHTVGLTADTFDGKVVIGEDSVQPSPDDGIEFFCPAGFDPVEYTSVDHSSGAATFLDLEIGGFYSCRLTSDLHHDFDCIMDPQPGDLNEITGLGFLVPVDRTCSSRTEDVFNMGLDNLCSYRCDIIR
jgi:hypothetical protein